MALAPSSPRAGELIVGYAGPINLASITALGGTVQRTMGGLNVVQVYVADTTLFTTRISLVPGVAFVEANDPLRPSGSFNGTAWSASSWDASSWDASSWDASSWDASSWDASSWDASSWDASSWDASSWDASSWDASSWDASSWDWTLSRDAGFGVQWGLGAARFDDAWTLQHGSHGAMVCVLDTGVDGDHPDLASTLWRNATGVAGVSRMLKNPSPADDVGHGTHVAGIVAAVGGNGIGVAGAAQETILSVKVMDAGGGREADLADGLTYCAQSGAKIGVMSLHVDRASPTLQRAVAYAQSRGMLLVAAAGNDGSTSVRYPAAYPDVVAVGAVGPDAKLAPFSNRGPRLDLVAPGVKIASTLWDDRYALGSGTSQAAPFVAAAAALVWEANPGLTASQVRATLLGTARDLGPAGPDDTFGRGALDAYAAVTAATAG